MTYEVKERKKVRDETAGMPGGAVTGDGQHGVRRELSVLTLVRLGPDNPRTGGSQSSLCGGQSELYQQLEWSLPGRLHH